MDTKKPTNSQQLQNLKERTITLRNSILNNHAEPIVSKDNATNNYWYEVLYDLVVSLNNVLNDIYTLVHISEYPANRTTITDDELEEMLILLGSILRLSVHQIRSCLNEQPNPNHTWKAIIDLEAHVSVKTHELQYKRESAIVEESRV